MKFTEIPGKSWMRWGDRSGRASRSEYWYSLLWVILISTVVRCVPYFLGVDDEFLTVDILSVVMGILTLPVIIRRLHDLNRSGGWFFIVFIPIAGQFLLPLYFIKRGTVGPNKYGEDPTSDTETKQQNTPAESSRRTRYSRRREE